MSSSEVTHLDQTWTSPRAGERHGRQAGAWMLGVWPDCSDEELLDELRAIVGSGWGLPNRTNRARDVRRLLLLVEAADSLDYRQAAQRLLILLDDTLREADNDLLGEDEATGCRILLGVHPTYRTVASPTRRRREAAEFLRPDWLDNPPKDPAGTFQRRHQDAALRQVLECLRARFGRSTPATGDYDVCRVHRWYVVGPGRQVGEYGERAEYRIRRDGVDAIELLEAEPDSDGLLESAFKIEPFDAEPPLTLEDIAVDPTRPGFRRITMGLGRAYKVGEVVRLAWREQLTYSDQAADWGRFWVNVSALNSGFEATTSVKFREDADRPQACWWFVVDAIVDLNEIGPDSTAHLLEPSGGAVLKRWSPAYTEAGRRYGITWAWPEDENLPPG